jgi:hypothetical protein
MPEGLDSGIDVVPIWNDYADLGGCYRRLKLFSPDIEEILGPRFVSIDLDMLVVNDLTPLFDHDLPFKMNRDTARNTHYNGALLQMDAGVFPDVWSAFDPHESRRLTQSKRMVGTDQAWISYVLGPGQPVWKQEDGVLSFRLDIITQPGPMKRFSVPEHARIINFHGSYDPAHESVRKQYTWVGDLWR